MKIRTVRIEAFKKFADGLTLDGFSEGLNLITAPNEGGKSTVAEAIRAAFLERHRSKLDELVPWSLPNASPAVRIEFTHQGRDWRIAKSFGARKSCALHIGDQALSGEVAESRLAELFSYSYAARGPSMPQHQGIPGLLWVRQGTASDIGPQVASAHEYISRALGNEVGELAATAGDGLLARVEAELAPLHTKGGKPTGDFARAIDQLEAARETLARQDSEIRQYHDAVDQLARLHQSVEAAEQEQPWHVLRTDAERTRAALRATLDLDAQREQQDLQLRLATEEMDRRAHQLQVFDAEAAAVLQREQALAQCREADERTRRDALAAQDRMQAASHADSAARTATGAARRSEARRHHGQALQSARQRLAEAEGREREVQGLQAESAGHEATLTRLQPFRGASRQLEALEVKVAQARARLEAIATRVEFELLEGAAIRLGDEPVRGAGARTLVDTTAIEIEGVGRLRIVPGAEDLAARRAQLARCEGERQSWLQQLGVPDAEVVREQEAAFDQAQAEVRRLRSVIAVLAPEGLAQWQAALAKAQGECAQHEAALARLPQASDEGGSVMQAEAHEALTRRAAEQAERAWNEARHEAAIAMEQLKAAEREWQAARARVEQPGRAAEREAIATALIAAQARRTHAERELAELQSRIRDAQPERLRQDLARLLAAADALEKQHRQQASELTLLRGELQAKGALGLEEEAASTREALARLEREVSEKTRRARSLTHLRDVLASKRAAVARSLRAPLRLHLNRYLDLLFPGARFEVDEALRPAQLARTGSTGLTEQGAFEAMSLGTREQLGIIARLAYADLLREAGKPTLLMLDDSLVNSDAQRLGQMKRVLWDAAVRHQIIIFTCHPESWRDLGVAPRRLQ